MAMNSIEKTGSNNIKPKLLIFLNAYWSKSGSISGGDQLLAQVLKRVESKFANICCFTSYDGKRFLHSRLKNIECKSFPRYLDRFGLFVSYVLRSFWSLGGLLSTNRPDFLHSGSDFFPDVIPPFLYKLARPKVKWISSVFHLYPNWKGRPAGMLRSIIAQKLQEFSFLLARSADRVMVINSQVKEALIKRGFDESRILVNPPGVDFDYFLSLKDSGLDQMYDASFLGRLHPSKGIYDLVSMWEIIVSTIPNANLAVIGGGEEAVIKELNREISKRSLQDNINIFGFLENDEAFSVLKQSKVFIFPSYEEGFGIAIAEAMACKIPVVVWDLDVYHEIFEDSVIKVKKGDFGLLAQEVIGLLEDVKRRNELSQRAHTLVKDKYSWEDTAKRYLLMLEGV